MTLMWKRIVARLRERGLRWCIRRAAARAGRLAATVMLSPIAAVAWWFNVRFAPIAVQHIGHLAVETDCYVKRQILDNAQRRSILLAPPARLSNQPLAEHWKAHLTVVQSRVAAAVLEPLSWSGLLSEDNSNDIIASTGPAAYYDIQRRWGSRPPLLKLSTEQMSQARKTLAELGVPAESWFVCVHARESGYAPSAIHDYRNADIETYLPAMQALVERGGWCIRMGDPTMQPLPPLPGIIDYAHSPAKTAQMDVYLSASCRFFLGTSSGLFCVATVFGVPCALANQAPLAVVLPYGAADRGIPKLLWSRDAGRFLTFPEAMASPVSRFRASALYEEAGIQVVDNDPGDIRDLALEMLDPGAPLSREDRDLQDRFKAMLQPDQYCAGAESRVGVTFLRKYRHLLEPPELARRRA